MACMCLYFLDMTGECDAVAYVSHRIVFVHSADVLNKYMILV